MVGTRKQLEVALIEKVDMPLNMVKTSSGYAYRKLIPADVRHIINKSEFKKSLGKDYLLAKSKCAKLEAQVTKMIEDARQMMAGQNSIDSYLKRSPDTRLQTIKASTAGLTCLTVVLNIQIMCVRTMNRANLIMFMWVTPDK